MENTGPSWRGIAVSLSVLSVLAGPTRALAAPRPGASATKEAAKPEPTTARGLYDAGKAELGAGRHESALELFRKGLALAEGDESESWRILLGIGLTYEQLKKPIGALHYYQELIRRAGPHRDTMGDAWARRIAVVESSVKRLLLAADKTHGRVSIVTKPAGAEVIVDGVRAEPHLRSRTPLVLFLEPGPHTIQLSRAGLEPIVRHVEAAAGELRPITVDFAVESEAVAGDTTPGWVLAGAGIGLAATGAIFGTLAAGDRDLLADLDGAEPRGPDAREALSASRDRVDRRREERELTSYVLYGVGAAAFIGGLTWALVAGSRGPDDGEASASDAGGPRMMAFAVAPSGDGRGGLAQLCFGF